VNEPDYFPDLTPPDTPYGDFLEERCRSELGHTFEDAMRHRPVEARAILRDVMAHRWPHLRGGSA
jgi:hypothetical protein